MSGTITSGEGFGISGLLNLGLNAIEPALFGTGDVVVLGNVVLTDFEVPERIAWGGTQKIHSHMLPGGERVFDIMGRDEHPLDWSGTFLGTTALDRAKMFDVMRGQGSVQLLTFGTLSYLIVIDSFVADYKHQYNIPYKISCEVLRDNSVPLPNNTTGPDTAVSNDVSSATDATPSDAPPSTKVTTKAETGPGTVKTQTYEPIAQTSPTVANASGSNFPTSATSMVDLGPSVSLSDVTSSGVNSVPTATTAAQNAADLQSVTDANPGLINLANAPLFTGT